MDEDIKIYWDDRVVVLSGKSIKNRTIDHRAVYAFTTPKALADRLAQFDASDDEHLCITHPCVDELLGHVAGCFKYIEAAGGVVTLPDGRVLLIKRHGKWDIPKGKAEKGETPHETAIREVAEECGLMPDPIITGELTHTYHTYRQGGNHILKHTAWYTMRHHGSETLHPQLAEDITEAVWMPRHQLNLALQNTYRSIEQVIDKWLNT
jgi:ADP-ribose pyrophosphatase YjhB (NUDIX family)